MENELISHPPRYNREGRPECIDEMVSIYGIEVAVAWCILNSHKYLYRCGLKDTVAQELAKVKWYEEWVDDHIDECDDWIKEKLDKYLKYKEEWSDEKIQ